MANFQFPNPADQTTVINPETGTTYRWLADPGKWVITGEQTELVGNYVQKQGGDAMEGQLEITGPRNAGDNVDRPDLVSSVKVLSIDNAQNSALQLRHSGNAKVYINSDDISLASDIKISRTQGSIVKTNVQDLLNITEREIAYLGQSIEDEDLITKKYVDDADEELRLDIIELEEELEALAPSLERGSWNYTQPLEPRGYSLFDIDGNSTNRYSNARSIFLTPVDTSGTNHSFDDVAVGSYIEIFDADTSDFGLYNITAIDDKTNLTPGYWVFTVDFVKSNGVLATAEGPARFKFFELAGAADPTSFVMKIGGDEMQGPLKVTGDRTPNNGIVSTIKVLNVDSGLDGSLDLKWNGDTKVYVGEQQTTFNNDIKFNTGGKAIYATGPDKKGFVINDGGVFYDGAYTHDRHVATRKNVKEAIYHDITDPDTNKYVDRSGDTMDGDLILEESRLVFRNPTNNQTLIKANRDTGKRPVLLELPNNNTEGDIVGGYDIKLTGNTTYNELRLMGGSNASQPSFTMKANGNMFFHKDLSLTGDLEIKTPDYGEATLTLKGKRDNTTESAATIKFENRNNSQHPGYLTYKSSGSSHWFTFDQDVDLESHGLHSVRRIRMNSGGSIGSGTNERIRIRDGSDSSAGTEIQRPGDGKRAFAIRGKASGSGSVSDFFWAYGNSGSEGDAINYTGKITNNNNITNKKYVDDGITALLARIEELENNSGTGGGSGSMSRNIRITVKSSTSGTDYLSTNSIKTFNSKDTKLYVNLSPVVFKPQGRINITEVDRGDFGPIWSFHITSVKNYRKNNNGEQIVELGVAFEGPASNGGNYGITTRDKELYLSLVDGAWDEGAVLESPIIITTTNGKNSWATNTTPVANSGKIYALNNNGNLEVTAYPYGAFIPIDFLESDLSVNYHGLTDNPTGKFKNYTATVVEELTINGVRGIKVLSPSNIWYGDETSITINSGKISYIHSD